MSGGFGKSGKNEKRKKLATLATPFHHPGRRLPRVPLPFATHTHPHLPSTRTRGSSPVARVFSSRAHHTLPPASRVRPARETMVRSGETAICRCRRGPTRGENAGAKKKQTRTIASSAPASPSLPASARPPAPTARVHHTVSHPHTPLFLYPPGPQRARPAHRRRARARRAGRRLRRRRRGGRVLEGDLHGVVAGV